MKDCSRFCSVLKKEVKERKARRDVCLATECSGFPFCFKNLRFKFIALVIISALC